MKSEQWYLYEMGIKKNINPSIPLAKTAGHLEWWCLKCKTHLIGELFHAIHLRSVLLLLVCNVQL